MHFTKRLAVLMRERKDAVANVRAKASYRKDPTADAVEAFLSAQQVRANVDHEILEELQRLWDEQHPS